jgi:3'(2'), 5'-bisphosphate nucleotidase
LKAGKTESLIDDIIAISRRAGAAINRIYRQDFEVVQKEDASPLTQADLASHCLIRDALLALTPDIPFLSEESVALDYASRAHWREYWLVDPLDGTKEFIKRNGEFTVNIALVRDHEPVMGVVHVPVSGVTYWGITGSGAMRVDRNGHAQAISVRRPCPEPVVVVGSRSHANPRLEQHLAALGSYELVSMGSSLKFCLVAEGKADFYPRLGPTSEWDTAAAHAVVIAAGGKVVTLDGQALRYNSKASLLNPEFLVIADPGRNWLALFSDYSPQQPSLLP